MSFPVNKSSPQPISFSLSPTGDLANTPLPKDSEHFCEEPTLTKLVQSTLAQTLISDTVSKTLASHCDNTQTLWSKGPLLSELFSNSANCLPYTPINEKTPFSLRITYAPERGFILSARGSTESIAEARYNLAARYRSGQGVDKNINEAIKLYRLAAEQGLAKAQLALAILFCLGKEVPQNIPEAVRCFFLSKSAETRNVNEIYATLFQFFFTAAEKGDLVATVNLTYMFAIGLGTKQNVDLAQQLLRTIENPHHRSRTLLATLLEDESSQLYDIAEAIELYRLAASNNNNWALFRLAYLTEHGKGMQRNLPEAKRLYARSIFGENPHAPIALALLLMEESKDIEIENDIRFLLNEKTTCPYFSTLLLYLIRSVGVAHQDIELTSFLRESLKVFFSPMFRLYAYEEQRDIFKKSIAIYCVEASKQGSAIAPFVLGRFTEKSNAASAIEQYQLSADRGYAPAMTRLGHAYLKGKIVPRNITKAFVWLQKATAKKHALAYFTLSNYYMGSLRRSPQNITLSALMCRKSANLGLPLAMRALSELYEQGDGVAEDMEKSRQWKIRANRMVELPKLGWVVDEQST